MAIEDKAAVPPGTPAGLVRLALTATRTLIGLVLIGLVVLNVVNALARAAGTVVIGIDEVLVFGMIWMVMLGMLLVTAENGHINFELVTSRVGPTTQRLLLLLVHVILTASCGYAAYQSFLFVQRVAGLGQTSMALGMPMLIPHSALIVGFGGTAIIAAVMAIAGIRRLIAGIDASGAAA